MKLELKDTLEKYTNGLPAQISISESGDKVFIVYNLETSNDTTVIAELYTNNNGVLLLEKKIYSDNEYKQVCSGYASPDFCKFSLLEHNNSETEPKIRLRLYDNNMSIVGERVFCDAYLPGLNFSGGSFSDDNKAVVVSYVVKDCNNQRSIIRLLKADLNLRDVAVIRFEGVTLGVTQFMMNDELYLTFTTSEGKLNLHNLAESVKPQFKLHVYKLKEHVLINMGRAKLPQTTRFRPLVLHREKHVIISVGTLRALDKEITLTQYINNENYESDNTHDSAELRLYKFNSCELSRLYVKKLNASVQSPVLHPDGRHLIFSQEHVNIENNELLNNMTGIMQLCTLNHAYEIKHCRLPLTVQRNFNGVFSKDGLWFLMSSSNSSEQSTKNIRLYKVEQNLDC